MNPTEIRDTNFAALRDTLEFRLRDVYRAFVAHGPGTTRRVAELSGLDLLSLRPRAHDLCELGLLTLSGYTTRAAGDGRPHREGVYEARTPDEWASWQRQNFPSDSQVQMGLNQGALTK